VENRVECIRCVSSKEISSRGCTVTVKYDRLPSMKQQTEFWDDLYFVVSNWDSI
jgi:hypothetical protein